MALEFVATIKRWQCVSSDAFPTEDIPAGSTIHVIDTGERYVYYDGSWEPDLTIQYALSAL